MDILICSEFVAKKKLSEGDRAGVTAF